MRRCYLCGKVRHLERHHIFGGANRSLSERYGLVVDLCHYCHNEPPDGVHFNPDRIQLLHELGEQKYLDETGDTVEGFIAKFGTNYLPTERTENAEQFSDTGAACLQPGNAADHNREKRRLV